MLYPVQNDIRNIYDLSGIWDFQTDVEETGEAAGWATGLAAPRPMAVPGSWNEQYEDIFNYLGLAWYVKRSYVPASWRGQRVSIRIGSACYFAAVYVNGVKVGTHEGGHLPFAIDITKHIQWDQENVFAISVENHLKPTRVPAGNMPSPLGMIASFPRTTFDFFPFAGLHRPVVLYSTPEAFIEDVTVVTGFTRAAGAIKGAVTVSVKLNNAVDGQASVSLRGGKTAIKATVKLRAGQGRIRLSVPNARLWSDKDPFLYDLTVEAGADRYTLKTGIRTIAVKGGQILLNGAPIQMNGFGRHEDFFASGKGLNLPLMIKDYQLMRWTGANSYRTSHYPYSEEEMQLADREGFLIIDEIPAVSLQFENEENVAERLRMCLLQVDALIARDKNHPSIVMWCVANEPLPANLRFDTLGQKSEDPSVARGKLFLETLLARSRALDPTRLHTVVTVMGGPDSWMEQCDVICMNRYWGWYALGGELDRALAMLDKELDQVWARWRKPVMMTEFGADTMAGMHGHPAVMWTEEYQAEYMSGHLSVAARKKFVAGMQVWNFADFAAVQSVMRVGGLNMKGVFTRMRTPKMAAHVLRKFWIKS